MKQFNNKKNTMSYYSTLFQKYRVDDNLLDSRTKKRAIGAVLEQIDKKVINKNDIIDKARLKRLRKAFGHTNWFKKVVASLTFATALTLFQTSPLKANTVLNGVSKSKSNFVVATIDEDSSIQLENKNSNELKNTKEITTTSLHFVSNKPLFNENLIDENLVLLDDDSDVSYTPKLENKALTVIDTTIKEWEVLAKSVKEGSILLLKKNDNPLDSILVELKKLGKVDSLNIISHGASGELHFNNKTISKESLERNKKKWQELGSYLSKDGDILLYGCNVASGNEGKEFIETLANLTKADIGASINSTGNSEKGGDWRLEVATGNIKSIFPMNSRVFNGFKQILALPNGVQDVINNWTASGDGTYFTTSAKSGTLQKTDANTGFAFGLSSDIHDNYSSNIFWMEISADGTNMATFELDSIKISEAYDTDTWTKLYVKGYDADANSWTSATNVSSIPADFTNATAPYTLSLNNATFNGKNLSKFRLYIQAGNSVSYLWLQEFSVSNAKAPLSLDSDGKVTAGDGVNESSTIYVPTTANSSGSAVEIFDFNISDGGSADATALTVTSLSVDVSGTDKSKLTYLLANPSSGTNKGTDLSGDITGTLTGSAVTFNLSSNNIVVADGTSEVYVVKAFFNDTNSITDNTAITLSIDGDSNVTVNSAGTKMASGQSAITNSSNAKMGVTATDINFTTEPANSVSGISLTQPVVKAIDAYNNTDVDWTGNIALTLATGSGDLSGTLTKTLSSGVATFTDVNYTALADGESFSLTATSSVGSYTATSNSVTSDVVATKLIFTAQPNPTTVQSGVAKTFTTPPTIKAVDANNTVDTDFSSNITLFKNQTNGTSTNFEMNATSDSDSNISAVTMSATSGVATFSGLQVGYTGTSGNTFTLEANATNLTHANSNTISVTAAPAAPSNILATVINSSDINLTWKDNSSNESNFSIYVSFNSGSSYEFNKTVNANIETYYYSNLALDSNYSFMVTASNSDGDTNASIADSNITAPTAPTNLSAVDVNSTQINLTWSDTSSNESGFKIYSSTTSGSGYELNGTVTGTEYNVTKLDENRTYYFKVGAYNSGGENNTSGSKKTNDIPNVTTLNSFSLNEDFGTDGSLVINTINDSDNDEINLSVESNDTSIFTFTKSWGDSNITSVNYNGTKTITLTSEANKSGVVELNVSAYDGKEYNTTIFNVTITPVNDTPTIDINNTLTVVEKKGGLITNSYLKSSDVDNNTTLTYAIVTAPTNGRLYKQTGAIELNATNSRTFTQAEIDANDINYTHDGSATTSDYFEFNVSDQSGAYTNTARFNITITEFNDPPTYDINMTDMTYAEDSGEFNLTLSNIVDQELADLNISVENNDSSLLSYTLSWGDSNLTNANYSGKDLNISIIPVANAYGKAELNVTVWDGTNRVTKDFNVTLSAVNDLPTSANATVSTVESRDLNFTSNDFNFTDVDGDTLNLITITSLQSKGDLFIDADSSGTINNAEANLSVDGNVSLANISKLVYKPIAGEFASPYTSFLYKVYDGTAYSANEYNMTINVTEINDPASFDINMTDINISEGASDFNITLLNINDPESRDLNITVESNDSTMFTITPNWTTNVTNATYSNDLNFTISPYTNAYGKAELNVTVSDGVNKTVKDFNITIAPSPDNPIISTISNISKDINFSDFNVSINVYDPDRGDVNLTIDINDTSLIDYNTTWYDSSNEYNVTYSETCESNSTFANCYYKDINLTIKSKPNVDGIVRVTIKAEDNVSGQVSKTFDINVSADNLVLADLNALSVTSPTTTNLTLASLGSLYNSAITWISNNTAVITNSGGVTQGTSDVSVTLTASANILHSTFSKTFSVTVTGTGDTGGGGSSYVPPTTNPTPAPTDNGLNRDSIIVIDENTNGGNVNENVVLINEVDTKTQIETYNDFSDNGDGTNSATVELKNDSGETVTTEIKTEIPKENVTITTVEGGVETKANVDNSDGSKTETTSKVNTNGTVVNKVKLTNADGTESTSQVSSTKVGTNVEIAKDGSLTTSFKDNHGMEVKAVASTDGSVHHEVDITNDKGEVVKTIAKSNVKGSQIVIKEDGTVQTSAHTTSTITNTDGSESSVDVLVVVEGKSDGKATHIMQVKDENGNSTITKAESQIDGAETLISADGGVETTANAKTTVVNDNGESVQEDVELKVQALPDGKATHKLKIVDANGNEQTTEATSEVVGAKTIITTNNTIETSATLTDSSGNENPVVVEAKSNGVAIHSLTVKDNSGENVVVEATSEVPNTKTVIKADGVETSAKVTNSNNENVDISVKANSDGKARHIVTVGGNGRGKVSGDTTILSTRSTFAYSEVKGAKTTIQKSGNVETTAQRNKSGIITKAYVDTNPMGESTTYFKDFDSEGNELETINTFQKGQFELGNDAIIKEENGEFKIDITSRVTKEIIF